MRFPTILPPLFAAAILAMPAYAQQDIFTYPYTIDDLDNGLRLVTIPTEYPDLVAVYIVVATGSRNEVEEGKSGFAHFFEHMMFRGTRHRTAAEQAALFKKAGAARNAYTTDDYTCYHTTFAKEDLGLVLELEADRFQHLSYPEKDFRTEAMAVLGEYNKNSANPIRKILEVTRDTAFAAHTYKHTTMGFLRDIVAMPKQYEYSQQFFQRWYKPEYTTILVVGDVQREKTLALVKQHWGAWPRGRHKAEIPAEPAQAKALSCHVPWPAPTQPWVFVAFKGPAFSTQQKDMPALDLLSALAFGENSELYKKLYVREQKVDALFPSFEDHVDPYLVGVGARVRDVKDLWYVRDQIVAEFEKCQATPVEDQKLAEAKAHQRYEFAAGLNSSEAIAGALAGYIARGRSPEVVNKLFRTYATVTAADMQAMAKKYFRESARVIATCVHGELPPEPAKAADAAASAGSNAGGNTGSNPGSAASGPAVLLPGPSPLVTFRLLFRTGAAADPSGKEGLAHVTARLLANGGTKAKSFEQIVAELYPMAAGIGFSVDKEMTVFHGTVHRDNLEAFYAVLRETLLAPGFRPDDFERARQDTLSYLDVELRRSNDEELGKEVMYNQIYRGHVYGHTNAGTVDSVKKLSLDDVKACHQSLLRSCVVGLAGGYPEGFAERVRRDFAGQAGAPPAIPEAKSLARNQLTIVQKQALATGIHFGFPIEVTRSHPDWAALWLLRSWLGEHRSENSHLYQRLREVRGLNYGDYAYIEYFPRGMFLFAPEPNHGRTRQIFQIWIRPVPPGNAPFAFKAAWYELDKLCREGLTQEEFEATRTYLQKQSNLLVKTQDSRLGYALDSQFYGTPEFAPWIKEQLQKLSRADVNRVLKQHLRSDRLQMVVVTEDAQGFKDAILSGKPTPITYQAQPGKDVLEEDRVIEALKIPLDPEAVTILPVEKVW